MRFISAIYYFFSRYTDSSERKVGRFFRRVNERNNPASIEKALIGLLQQDVAVINLWTEHKYKGYDYLTKKVRKELYKNLVRIQQDFTAFCATQTIDQDRVVTHLISKGADASMLRTYADQAVYMLMIMRYLAPSHGKYVYRESSSFGRLLRDPSQEVLEGDCNQIVTLYIALYAMKYNVADLKLTLFPGHVALHFFGIDVETTSGQFTRYHKEGQTVAPIHEIVSVNLLDTTDSNFTKSTIDPEVFLEAARLAYVVSSNRVLVKRNLEGAYRNAVRHLLRKQAYEQAVDYARQSTDHELIETSVKEGVVDAIKKSDFSTARRFAGYSQDREKLKTLTDQNEAVYLFNNKKYLPAAKIYEKLKDRAMVRRSYYGAYAEEQRKLKGAKSVADIRAHAHTIRIMQGYARLSEDEGLQNHANGLAKYL